MQLRLPFAVETPPDETRRGGVIEMQGNPIFEDDFHGWTTESGQAMDWRRSFQHAGVWQAISLISGCISKLDIHLHRDVGGTSSEPLYNHPYTFLCNNRPNDELNARKFWRRTATHLCMWGNAYIWVRRDRAGMPIELIHLLPDRTYPLRPSGQELVYIGGFNKAPYYRTLMAPDVVHVEMLQDVGVEFLGLDTKWMARHSWALGLSQEQFMSKFYRRGGRPGGILELEEGTTPKAAKNLARQFRNHYESPDLAFKTIVLEEGAKFQESQHTFRDTEMVNSKEENNRDAARWFNLRPGDLGLSDSVSYNSRSEDARALVDQTIGPITRNIEAELNYKLLSLDEQRRQYFRFDLSQMLQPDLSTRVAAYQILVQNKIMTVNEIRQKENLPPIEGGDEFDEPTVTPDMGNPGGGEQDDD